MSKDVLVSVPHGLRTINLAIEIADEAAIREAKGGCRLSRSGGGAWWYDPHSRLTPRGYADSLARALEYLALRGLIEYSADGKLVRFVEEGK